MSALRAPTLLEGFNSRKSGDLAREQLSRGSSHPLLRTGDAFEILTWAFLVNLGLIGLVYSAERIPEGTLPIWREF